MDPVVKTPQTEVANATAEARKGSMKRPKKLVKGSAAAKRWMAHVRSHRKSVKRKAKSPARKHSRKHHKSPARHHRKRSAKTPKRKPGRPRKVGRPKKSSKRGRK